MCANQSVLAKGLSLTILNVIRPEAAQMIILGHMLNSARRSGLNQSRFFGRFQAEA
jgi:hypothetical protein